MFENLRRYLIFPVIIMFIAVYIVGLRVVQHRSYTDMPVSSEYEAENKSDAENLAETAEKININTADINELVKIKGIGESIAERIIEYREAVGEFISEEELMEIDGIGEKVFDDIKNYITVK